MDEEASTRSCGKIVQASYVKRAKKFQRGFIEYFPNLADIEVALDEWSWLHSHWTLNQIHTVRRSQDLEKLDRVIQALRLLAKSDWWPWWGTIYDAQKAAEADDADRVTQDLGSIAAALVELVNINLPNEDGAAVRLENALGRLREGAVEEMSRLPDTGSTKWDAAHGNCMGLEPFQDTAAANTGDLIGFIGGTRERAQMSANDPRRTLRLIRGPLLLFQQISDFG